MSRISHAEDIRIEEYFGYPRLSIPLFQRAYVWRAEEIEEFWDDLIEGEIQFLGSIILNNKNYDEDTRKGTLEIVDGQQRTISLLLLLSLISRKLASLSGRRRKDYEVNSFRQGEEINRLISERDRDDLTKVLSYKLVLPSQADNDALKCALDGEESGIKNFDSAVESLENHLGKHLTAFKNAKAKTEELVKIKNRILDIKIIQVLVPTDEDAYVIFETVNARGADLGAADLLKNFLCQILQKPETVQDAWVRIKDTLDEIDRKSLDFTGFLRYYWIGKYKHVSKRSLYKDIKLRIRQDDSARKILDEIEGFRLTTERVFLADYETWRAQFASVNSHQPRSLEWFSFKSDLDYFPQSIQYLPVYTALLGNITVIDRNNAQYLQLLLSIEKINFVYSYILQKPTNRIDKMLSSIGREILAGAEAGDANKTVRAAREGLGKIESFLAESVTREPVDRFIEELSWKRAQDKRIMYFILSGLEYAQGGYSRFLSKDNLTLEHVFPKSAENAAQIPGWPKVDFDYAKYGHGLGNITFLAAAGPQANGSAGEEPFSNKRDHFFKVSPYVINRYFNDIEEWDGGAIQRRLRHIQDAVWERWGVAGPGKKEGRHGKKLHESNKNS